MKIILFLILVFQANLIAKEFSVKASCQDSIFSKSGEYLGEGFIDVFNSPGPEPIGGIDSIYSQIKYPVEAIQHNVEGKVLLMVTVSKDGNTKNVEIQKSVGYGCDEEAKRVLFNTKWVPVEDKGEKIEAKVVVPINFILSDL